jgi:hypothetical protein
MGLFLMAVAAAIVVLQSTLILSNREPNLWVFSLLQRKDTLSSRDWTNIKDKIHKPHAYDKGGFEKNVLALLHSTESALSPFATCMEKNWIPSSSTPPLENCRIWHHAPQKISSIFDGSSWNPHLILLVIASIHLLLSFLNSQEHFYLKEHSTIHGSEDEKTPISTRIYHFPSGLALFILAMVCLIVGLIASNRNASHQPVLDAPTIIVAVILFLTVAWFLRIHNLHSADQRGYHIWSLIFQMQIIGVPLTVLMIAVMGARFYTDIVSHFILLSVAVNSLWLQNHLRAKEMGECNSDVLLTFLRLLTIAIPLFSICMAQVQWGGANTWQQITVFMAFFSLAPLFIHSFYPMSLFDSESDMEHHHSKWRRLLVRLGNLCSSAALGSSVINLALL